MSQPAYPRDEIRPAVSVVIPMHNEAGAVDALIDGIAAAAADLPAFEIVAVDDGSTDDTQARLIAARARHPQVRVLCHPQAGGQSAAVHAGVRMAHADICCTIDGDGQNPPEELPKLWGPLLHGADQKVALVAGQRQKRQDTLSKRLASRFANALRSWMLRDGTRDTGCGLKGFRRDAFLQLPYFNHMHRYLPALFKAQGWGIAFVDVAHKPRTTGTSKYNNFQRAVAGAYDLIGVMWLIRRSRTVNPEEL